ncbi:RidA family protein [Sphingomonas koreensis]|uniref:RidA family protein n=2 Tax=Sphingomonas koreensis TaxID=93064 RepID=A0A430G0C4_9SPHN|nr:RidA family protein [Sphingomonas koreensis]
MTIERIGGVKSGTGGQALPFCQATRAGGFVFVSGQVAMDANGEIVAGGIVEQTHQTIRNLLAILEKSGCTAQDLVKINVWLDDARDFQSFNRVYGAYFGEALPARSCVQSPLMVDAKVEIDAIAYRAPDA